MSWFDMAINKTVWTNQTHSWPRYLLTTTDLRHKNHTRSVLGTTTQTSGQNQSDSFCGVALSSPTHIEISLIQIISPHNH